MVSLATYIVATGICVAFSIAVVSVVVMVLIRFFVPLAALATAIGLYSAAWADPVHRWWLLLVLAALLPIALFARWLWNKNPPTSEDGTRVVLWFLPTANEAELSARYAEPQPGRSVAGREIRNWQ